jgi:phage terminase small subunit
MKNRPKPPDKPEIRLSPAAMAWKAAITAEYDVGDAAGRLLLNTALQAFDRMSEAGALVAEHGPLVRDKWGQLKPNPACAIERDARGQMMTALKHLNLDIEPLRDGPGRPPGRC